MQDFSERVLFITNLPQRRKRSKQTVIGRLFLFFCPCQLFFDKSIFLFRLFHADQFILKLCRHERLSAPLALDQLLTAVIIHISAAVDTARLPLLCHRFSSGSLPISAQKNHFFFFVSFSSLFFASSCPWSAAFWNHFMASSLFLAVPIPS